MYSVLSKIQKNSVLGVNGSASWGLWCCWMFCTTLAMIWAPSILLWFTGVMGLCFTDVVIESGGNRMSNVLVVRNSQNNKSSGHSVLLGICLNSVNKSARSLLLKPSQPLLFPWLPGSMWSPFTCVMIAEGKIRWKEEPSRWGGDNV